MIFSKYSNVCVKVGVGLCMCCTLGAVTDAEQMLKLLAKATQACGK